MTFRTPAEAVELANNTRYGLAASLWTENINLALDVAPQLKAGTVWINCTNLFDAASGFGGYRESGFGREGGLGGVEGVREVGGRSGIGRSGGRAVAGSKTRARRKSVRAASVATPRPPTGRPTVFLPSIAPRSSTSAASRRAQTPATACLCSVPMGGGSARSDTETGRTSGTRSKPRERR